MKASESIRLLVDKANRDLDYKAPEIRNSYLLNVLHRVIELIEAQEQIEAWVPFAERMPDAPIAGDRRVILCRLTNEAWEVFTNDDYAVWLDSDGTPLSRYRSCTHWRSVTPPEVT